MIPGDWKVELEDLSDPVLDQSFLIFDGRVAVCHSEVF